jgi:hypothetical protein
LKLLAARHQCAIHAYVLMSNHVRLLLTPGASQGTSHRQGFDACGKGGADGVGQCRPRAGTGVYC